MKLCKDCKHCRRDRINGRAYCSKKDCYETDKVTGARLLWRKEECKDVRMDLRGMCGSYADWFEQRKPWWRFWK
jgi:hypothetical protein